jgi:signal transduction histidine kinase
MMDTGKMRRVFSNLVQNAIKYAEGMDRIVLDCNVVNLDAVISFEDNGRGIPTEELGSIFKKFYRIDKSRSREKGGCGLGLAICQSIVERHGGEIEASQGNSGGLKITLRLPAKAS